MKKIKRISALIAVIILVGMYGISLVAAVMARPDAIEFFKVSIVLTIFIPILIYCFIFICRLVTGNTGLEADEKEEKKTDRDC